MIIVFELIVKVAGEAKALWIWLLELILGVFEILGINLNYFIFHALLLL